MNNLADIPREKLREILARTGEAVLQDSERCEGLLKDHCGGHRKEISAIVGALEERIPLELRSSWQTAMTPEAMRARLVQRLQDNRGLAPDIADWAVEAWSYALGVGLGRSSDRLPSQVLGGLPPVPPFAQASQAGWVGSQILPQGPPPAAVLQPQPAPVTGNGMKAALAVAALCVAGYFVIPLVLPTENKEAVPAPKPVPVVVVTPPAPPPAPVVVAVLPIGTLLPVRIGSALTSTTVAAGQYVNGTLTAALKLQGREVIPAGTKVVMQINEVDGAGRLAGVPQIKMSVYQVGTFLVRSRQYVAKGPSRTVNTVKKGGLGAAIGCGAGAVIGVFTRKTKKGCGVGAAGGGGVGVAVAATDEIKPAVIGAGAVITFSLIQPLSIG